MLTIVTKNKATLPKESLKKKKNTIPVRNHGLKNEDTSNKIITNDQQYNNSKRTDVKNPLVNKQYNKKRSKTTLKKKSEKKSEIDYFGRWHFQP